MLSLDFLSVLVIFFSLIFLNFNLGIQLILFMVFIFILLYKKYKFWYIIFILLIITSWNIRLEERDLLKDNFYQMKVLKIGNRGKVLKINNKIYLKKGYINLSYLDIQDGLYSFDVNVKKIQEKRDIFYIDVEFLNFKNHWSNKFRNYLRNKIGKISKTLEIEAFLKSVVLAENSDLNEELKNKFNYLGISHIIVISGLHMGILLFGILYILKLIGVSYNYKHLLTLIMLTLYASLLGFTPSVQRSYIMAVLYIVSKLVFEKKDIKKSFHVALLISLIYKPQLITDIGFQMSYIAVFSIIYVYPLVEMKFVRKITKYIVLTIVIQILLAPIFLYYFKSLYILSFVANLLIIPLAGILINFSFLALFLGILNLEILNNFLGEILNILYRSLNGFVNMLNLLPFMQIQINREISFFMFIWFYTGIILVYIKLRKNPDKQVSLKK